MNLSGSEYTNDIIINWTLTAVAIVLTIGRYVIRYIFSQKLFWDDLAHLFALLTLITHGGLNQVTLQYKNQLQAALASNSVSPDVALKMREHQSYLNTINNCLLYLVFWEVKVSFLLFYRHLFNSNRRFNTVWWVVLVLTLCLIWAPLGGVLTSCAGARTLADYKICNSADADRTTKLIYTCVVNVVTDLAIMALPFWMLKELQIRASQKWALGFVFSLAIVTMVLDIVRTIKAIQGYQDLYTVSEVNLNVILSALPSYRALFRLDQRRSKKQYAYASGTPSRRDGILDRIWSASIGAGKGLKYFSRGKGASETNQQTALERQPVRVPYNTHIDSSTQSLVDLNELQKPYVTERGFAQSHNSVYLPIQSQIVQPVERGI